jgi:sugar phosphate isomerase/epimerase
MADFQFGMNTSTIKPAGLMEKIHVTAQAGYDAIELWVMDVEAYLAQGHPLSDVRKALDDAGLDRPSMIYLKDWHDRADEVRRNGLEDARRRLDIAAQLGVKRFVASPPLGLMPADWVGTCYRDLLELAAPYGVWPSFEYLGFVQQYKTIESAWEIVRLASHQEATITHDAWHIFRGGGTASALDIVPIERISIFHWDDAPSNIARDKQTDSDRVMPGDGILDLAGLANQLRRMGWRGVLSLELFNEAYWARDPLEVARLGLEKMKASVN